MRKQEELSDPNSCLNRAEPGEMIFVLLGRDVAAPAAIEKWAGDRIRLGKNTSDDQQIRHALSCANVMRCDQQGYPHFICPIGECDGPCRDYPQCRRNSSS
jgi:hypothetical protein